MGSEHAVVIVGYDTRNAEWPYWIIKNSWGEDWGEKGYLYMLMGRNICFVEDKVTAPYVV